MTIKLNHDQLDHHAAVSRGDAEARVDEPSLYGAISGQIAVGRHVLQIGEASGGVVREASRTERAHIRPRPTPVLVRPRLIRGLFDRGAELTAALSALDAGLPVEVSGESGIGKTALLRHLAHHPRAASFVDGIVYLHARHHTSADLQQLLFEAFFESDEICKPTDTEIRRGLQDKQALIVLDDVRVSQHELEQVLDIAPRSAFAVATRERCLWGEVRSIALKGLPVDHAVSLLEREMERTVDGIERAAAATLCAAFDGHPRRIMQAAAIAREQGMLLDICARNITPANLVTELMASTDEKQRRALLALAALPGVPLRVQHIAAIADVTDLDPALMLLARRGVIVSSDSRHRLASGIGDQLRRKEDLKPWVNRAITYFTAWSERYRRSPASLLEESDALVRAQQSAADARRWGEVLRIGQLLEGALILGARWGAWAVTLEQCLTAARSTGDRSAEAWALHELGTRALCLGELGKARASLSQAAKQRDASDDAAGAAASRRNLSLVLAPEPESAPQPPGRKPGAGFSVRTESAASVEPRYDLESLPLRQDIQLTLHGSDTSRVGAVILTIILATIVGGFSYWAGLSWDRWNVASIGSFLQRTLGGTTPPARASQPVTAAVDAAASPAPEPVQPAPIPAASELEARGSDPVLTPPVVPPSPTERASILIFTPRPGSVAAGAPTRLCYAVNDAVQARVEPDIGDVPPTSTLNCLRATPARTTTYELTATGRDGHRVRRQLVIIVR
ncbi:MAG TPA: NB-ARC domain-containing protein [Vicinamibacterales bacterium]|nr:NB-ARC domain-containing protein [Vicinamibacterales bacterium]